MAVQKPAEQPLGATALSIARMLWKRKLQIGIVWALVSVAGYVAVSRLSATYKAEVAILINTQQIPDRYVSSTVVSDAQDRLASISQQILSTGRLQKIIEDFDLYHEERRTHFLEEIITTMRTQDIELLPERTATGRTNSFRISFQGPDPNVVARVANKLANLYVEENLKTRENLAEGTTEFIETKLKEAKQRLDELEAAVSQYQLSHNGELPQQEQSLNGVLSRLGTALEANRDAANRAQQQKVMLQDALSVAEDSAANQERGVAAAALSASSSGVAQPANGEPKVAKKSEDLEAQLADLRLRYSDSHPEIRRMRALIDRVKREEERIRMENAAASAAAHPVAPPAPQKAAKPPLSSPQLTQTRERIASLKSQLEFNEQELQNRGKEQQRILNEISIYQGRVNSMPIREQEMSALTRDYEISKANYRSLLDKKIAADMSTDMERREKSERFNIIDPARVPGKPFKPNRQMLRLAGVLGGLVLGLALGLGREFQQASLLGEWELPAGVPVLGRLPRIEIAEAAVDESGRRRKRQGHGWKSKLALLSSLLSALAIIMTKIYLASHRY